MDLSAHFAAMWRHRWVVLVASVLVTLVALAFFSLQPKVYRADAQLNVTAGGTSNGQTAQDELDPFLATTYADLAETNPVLTDAAKLSGLHISEQTADARISALTPGNIGLIDLSATGPSPSEAVALDKAISKALVFAVNAQQQQVLQQTLAPLQKQIQSLANQLNNMSPDAPQRATLETQYQSLVQSYTSDEATQLNEVSVISPADAGSSPVSPAPKRDALLAFVTSLVVLAELSVGYEVVSDRFSRTTQDDEIRRLTGLPVLARIPRTGGPDLVEAFRTLRTSLLFMNGSGKVRTVAIVSSAPEVGKSFVSIKLAGSFADLGVHVALIDADMRRPAIAARLGLSDSPGLSEALNGGDVVESLVRRSTENGLNVFVMAAGSPAPDPAALLSGRLSEWVFPGLSGFDTVVVDTPADSVFPDASIIASRCDAVVIVIDATNTKRRSLSALLEHLHSVGARPHGVVVNRVQETNRTSRYRSANGYYSRARETEQVTPIH